MYMKVILTSMLLSVSTSFDFYYNGYHKCPKTIDPSCLCAGPYSGPLDFIPATKVRILRGAAVFCTNISRHKGLADVTSSLQVSKLPKSVFLSDDLSYSKATTVFSYVNGQITKVDNKSLAPLINVRYLNLTDNKIEILSPDAFLTLKYVEVIDLSGNRFSVITDKHFFNLRQLVTLCLKRNLLMTLPVDVFLTNKKLTSIYLAENEWFCDEHMVWLDKWLKQSPKRNLVDSPKIRCTNSSFRDEVGALLRTSLRNIVVRKNMNKSSTCHKLCKCYPENGFPIVDCSNRGLTKMPDNIPKHTRHIYLKNNEIGELEKSLLTSECWRDVRLLDLSNNSIHSVDMLGGTKLLRSLGALDLSSNFIDWIPIHLLQQMNGIQVLKLSGNPWKCDCNTVMFQNWLQIQYSRVKDWDNVRCANKDDNQFKNKAIYTLKKTVLCVKSPESVHYLDVLSIIMALLIILIVGRIIYDYCCQKRTGKLPAFSKLL